MRCPLCDGKLEPGATECAWCGAALQTDDAVAPGQRELLAGRFELVRRVGRGGIGSVWLAKDLQLDGEPVACKVLKQELHEDRRAVADLKREVLLTRRLRHANILPVYTFWETDDKRFITMEFVEGENLADTLFNRSKPFAVGDILPWVRCLCEALDYAHANGVLHRDVKPGNILLDTQNQVQLADFGIARTAREVSNRLTGEMTCGTLMYVSPEQLMGEPMDRRSDLYSLATSTYELLSGQPPFVSGSIITQIQMKPAAPIAGLDDAINGVLLKALEKNAAKRHNSCLEFFHALEGAAGQAGPGRLQALPTVREDNSPEDDTVVLPKRDSTALRRRLGTVLLEAGAILPSELDQALAEQGRYGERLGEVLTRMGVVNEEAIAQALSEQMQLPLSMLEKETADPEVADVLTREMAAGRQCLPLRRNDAGVVVAMADPLDLTTLNELEATFQTRVDILIATPSAVSAAIKRYYDLP